VTLPWSPAFWKKMATVWFQSAWKTRKNSGPRWERRIWDVINADHQLPHFNAPAALRILHETAHDIPFIVVSGTIGEDLAMAIMKAGAHDYLMKNNLSRLAPAVEREIREARSRSDGRDAERVLHENEERLALAINATTCSQGSKAKIPFQSNGISNRR
jgi:DNA-binding NtrC family response regulator